MKKHTVILSFILGLFLVGTLAHANAVTYKISVIIPEIIGVNVSAETANNESTPTLTEAQISSIMDVTTEEVLRNDRLVLVRSYTVK